MTEITKQDFEKLTSAMTEGFQGVHDRLEKLENLAVLTRTDQIEMRSDVEKQIMLSVSHSKAIDRVSAQVEDLSTESAAGTLQLRRVEKRVDAHDIQLSAA